MARAVWAIAITMLCQPNDHGIVDAFAPSITTTRTGTRTAIVRPLQQAEQSTVETVSFIDTELRGAAMRLHTREQAPKEGQAPSQAKPSGPPYVTTHADYLRFLVDSRHVYQALEDVVKTRDELAVFRQTGLERTQALEQDIAYMTSEYNLKLPAVGKAGREYAKLLRNMESVPRFVCHYYNFYFAHTA